MYIAMNRFKVALGREADFETMWRGRPSHIASEPGFVAFNLLKGPTREDHTLYSSHTVWQSKADFEAWTKSEAFRKAHSGAGGSSKGITIEHPQFEGFEALADLTLTVSDNA